MHSGAPVVLGKYLLLDIKQEIASQAVIHAPRLGHALQDTEDKKVDSFTVKLIGDFAELGDFIVQAFPNGQGAVLSGALTKSFTKLRKMLIDRPCVIPSAFSECRHGWRRRLLKCFLQQPLCLVRIKGWFLAKADAPPIGDAENVRRFNRIRWDIPSEECRECHIQCARDPQISGKHGQFAARSPRDHSGWADSQYSRSTGQTLGISDDTKQTRELCPAQQRWRMKTRADHIFYLLGDPYLPLRRFRRKKRIARILGSCFSRTKPFLAPGAIADRTTLAEEWLRLSTKWAGQLKGAMVVRAVLHDFQRPKQWHVYGLASLLPSVQALRTPTRNAAGQQLCRQDWLPRQHGEIVKISSPSEAPDYCRETRSDIANAVDGGSETAGLVRDSAREHVSVSGLTWKKFTVVQNTSRYGVRCRKSGKVARQALDKSCSKADRIEVIEPATRRKLYLTQIPGFVFDHRFSWHARLHE